MRTIKYRGKTKDGEWVYGYYLPSIYEDVDIITVLEDFNLNQKNYAVLKETVGQFTGLLDCKGNEIYEGDILGLPETDSNGIQFRNRFARVVEWINDGFFLIDREERCGEVRKYGDRLALEISLNSNYSGIAKCLEEYGNYAVIGNIHDNPIHN